MITIIIGASKMGMQPGLGLREISAAITQAEYIYLGSFDLRGHVRAGSGKEIKWTGGTWRIAQDGAASLYTSARKDRPDGSYITFQVWFDNETDASDFRYYCVSHSENSELALFLRDYTWYFRVWGIQIKQLPIGTYPTDYMIYQYEVSCYLYSPYTYESPSTGWHATNVTLPYQSQPIGNIGHYDGTFESLAITCHYLGGHVKALTLSFDGTPFTITDEALSEEVITLYGLENRITESYEDLVTSATQANHDVTGTWAFTTDHLWIGASSSVYYKLSGPHPTRYPVVMTADLRRYLSTGTIFVDISSNTTSWTNVLTEADLVSGQNEYVLDGSEYMTDIYVRFRTGTGTALEIYYLKFDVERWVEDGSIPTVPVGYSRAASLSCNTSYSKSVDISGSYRAIRHLV